MITETQYLRALETIDLYHRQKSKIKDFPDEKEVVLEKQKTDLYNVKVGDFLIYKRANGKTLKGFKLGKKYKVIDKKENLYWEDYTLIKLENEFGKGTWTPIRNHYRRWETL